MCIYIINPPVPNLQQNIISPLVHPSMAPHRLGAVLLLLSAVVAAILVSVGAPPLQPGSSCQRKYGDVDIPFPFGISSSSGLPDNCSLPGFNLACNPVVSGGVYKPFYLKAEVLGISLQKGQARMRNHISSNFYNTTDKKKQPTYWVLDFIGTPYSCSDTSNKFTVIGSRALAYIQDDTINKRYIYSCYMHRPMEILEY
jgi:hypothetical protein